LMTPIWIIIVLCFLPSAIGLYILVSTLFSIIQQIIINKSFAFQENLSRAKDKK